MSGKNAETITFDDLPRHLQNRFQDVKDTITISTGGAVAYIIGVGDKRYFCDKVDPFYGA